MENLADNVLEINGPELLLAGLRLAERAFRSGNQELGLECLSHVYHLGGNFSFQPIKIIASYDALFREYVLRDASLH